ncbi:unnamed protein product, partial [marine sediment metagenome]
QESSSSDLPIAIKDEVKAFLEEKGWEPKEIIDPTLLKRLCRQV